MLPRLHQPSPGAAGDTMKFQSDGNWVSAPDQYLPCCANFSHSLANWAPLDVHWGSTQTPHAGRTRCCHMKVFHFCWLWRGPYQQRRLVFTSFQPGTERSLGCTPTSIQKVLAILESLLRVLLGECWAFINPPLGWEQPWLTRTCVLDPGLWTLPPIPCRTTTNPRLNRSGNQLALFRKGSDEA